MKTKYCIKDQNYIGSYLKLKCMSNTNIGRIVIGIHNSILTKDISKMLILGLYSNKLVNFNKTSSVQAWYLVLSIIAI